MSGNHENVLSSQESSATAAMFEIGEESETGQRFMMSKSASDEFDCRQFRTKEFDTDKQTERITVEKHRWEALEIQNRVLKSDLLQSNWKNQNLEGKLSRIEDEALNDSRISASMSNFRERLLLLSLDAVERQHGLSLPFHNQTLRNLKQELGILGPVDEECMSKLAPSLQALRLRIVELEHVIELQHAKICEHPNRREGDLGSYLCKSGISNNLKRISDLAINSDFESSFLTELRQIDARVNELEDIQKVQDNKILGLNKLNNDLKQLIVGMNLAGRRKDTTELVLCKYNDLQKDYLALVARHAGPQ